MLLQDNLIKLRNKCLPCLQTTNLHNTVLAVANLIAVFLLVAVEVFYLALVLFHHFPGFAHLLQRCLFLALFQSEHHGKALRAQHQPAPLLALTAAGSGTADF